MSKTYDACKDIVGISDTEGNQRRMLLPLYHTLKESNITIWLSQSGQFIRAERDKVKKNEDKVMICIPCTEESESRSSTGAWKYPHPLFDQIKYLTSDIYLENLAKWVTFLDDKYEHIIAYKALNAVYEYMKRQLLKFDLSSCGIKSSDKLSIRFCVNIDGHKEDRLWMMPEIWEAWTNYLLHEDIEKQKNLDVCYISGNKKSAIALNHPKSINRVAGNAKLISGNDEKNFTFRGRFIEPLQAVTVSFEASQKAHQALRWLISKQSCYRCDTQAIIAWAIDFNTETIDFFDDSYGIYESKKNTDSDKLIKAEGITYIDYSDNLHKVLYGYGNKEKLKQHTRQIAILATDAASDKSGRLSVTYYKELSENRYMESIEHWHNTCKWYQPFIKEKGNLQLLDYFIGATSLFRITKAVIGKKRNKEDKSYDKQQKILREQLIHCIFDGDKLPIYMMKSAVNRASNPLSFEKPKKRNYAERWIDWEEVLCAACALTKKYYFDYEKEDFNVFLEIKRKERNYLFGRLLALADYIESTARYKQGKTKDDARATNAIRYMTVFSQRPFRTWNMLFTQMLNPYIQQLNGAGWHLNIISEIMELLGDQFEDDTPLDGRYLLGFFAQRQALRQKNNNQKDGGKSNESKG